MPKYIETNYSVGYRRPVGYNTLNTPGGLQLETHGLGNPPAVEAYLAETQSFRQYNRNDKDKVLLFSSFRWSPGKGVPNSPT